MPKQAALNPAVHNLKPSVFATLAAQFKTLPTPPIPLHLGDTYRAPPAAAQWQHVMRQIPDNPYVYANPLGMEELRSAVAERLAKKGLPGQSAANVHPTSGGTAALALLAHTWLQPGDEALILAPFWPIIRGIVHSVSAVPVEVPFYDRLRRGETVSAILDRYVTPRTSLIYVTSPNNPCGTVLTPAQTAEIAAWSQRHDLWVIADEAYHDFVFDGGQHTFLAALPGMAERTATVLTASKSFALAGTRVGFLVGATSWLDAARRVGTHMLYQLPIVCQVAALGALQDSEAWVDETRGLYQEAARLVANKLQGQFAPAQGGAYVFVDLADVLRGRPCIDYISELLQQGVCISPGDVFGSDFGGWARVCYTAVPLDTLAVGIDRLNRSFERARAGLMSSASSVAL